MSRQLREIASWKLVSEFLRRHPNEFRLIETHPGGGLYDCLTLVDPAGLPVAEFNREGDLQIWRSSEGRRDSPKSLDVWGHLSVADDPKEVLDLLSREIGVAVPSRLPRTGRPVLVYRFVAALLSQSVFGRAGWECRNGFFDSSGEECGVRPYFDSYPAARQRLGKPHQGDIAGQPAFRFWFVIRDDEPLVCLETTGHAWLADGLAFDLTHLYEQEHRVWPVVQAVAGRFLG
jgi:hypothetical protein